MTVSKDDSIRLHPKYGLNPTLGLCFWCGEETGEIGLMGQRLVGEAPKYMVLSMEPCEKCREGMSMGFTLIEATKYPNKNGNNAFIGHPDEPIYPTGRWWVLTMDAAARVLGEDVEGKTYAAIDSEVVKKLGLENEI